MTLLLANCTCGDPYGNGNHANNCPLYDPRKYAHGVFTGIMSNCNHHWRPIGENTKRCDLCRETAEDDQAWTQTFAESAIRPNLRIRKCEYASCSRRFLAGSTECAEDRHCDIHSIGEGHVRYCKGRVPKGGDRK